MLVLAPVAAFTVTLLLLAVFLRTALFEGIQDIPNQRSLHVHPIPRVGGIAVVIGAFGAYITLGGQSLWAIVVPVLLLISISFADDVWGLLARWRFLAHVVAAAIFVYWGLGRTPVGILSIVVVITIIWMINLFNFMDGSDGLAGGMAVVGFSAYGFAASLGRQGDIAAISFSVVGAATAFLLYNFHPAKVFLGDVGSIPLGFAAGSIGFLGWSRGIWPHWFPLLVFSPFIVDATLTLVKRLARREKVWEAHRDHYYQRLVRMGWGHRRTAIVEYTLMICVGISALSALRWTSSMQYSLLIAWTFVYMCLIFLVDRAWRRYRTVSLASS